MGIRTLPGRPGRFPSTPACRSPTSKHRLVFDRLLINRRSPAPPPIATLSNRRSSCCEVADRGGVEERDHADQSVAHQRAAVFDFAVREPFTAKLSLAVAARRSAVGVEPGAGQVQVRRHAADDEVGEHPARNRVPAARRDRPVGSHVEIQPLPARVGAEETVERRAVAGLRQPAVRGVDEAVARVPQQVDARPHRRLRVGREAVPLGVFDERRRRPFGLRAGSSSSRGPMLM